VRLAAAREPREDEPVVAVDGILGDAEGGKKLGRRLGERGGADRGAAGDPRRREDVECGRLGPPPVR